MKAARIVEPGKIVIDTDVPKPEAGPGDVLLKVKCCSLCGTDQRIIRGEKKTDVPIPGHEITGVVEALGDGVEGIKMGGRYAVQTVVGCGECPMCKKGRENLCMQGFKAIGYQWNGGFAEYMVMPAKAVKQGCLIELPDSLSDEEGTLIEPLSCCVNGMRPIPFEKMDHIIVLGAGPIGLFNALIAKARGAKRVTIMNRSQGKLDLIKDLDLGVDDLINYSEIDPEEWVKEQTDGFGVDAVIVGVSAKDLVPMGLSMLGYDGHLSIFAGMDKADPYESLDLNKIHYSEIHVHGANASAQQDYLDALDFIASGKIDVMKVVTHSFSLDDFLDAAATQQDGSKASLKICVKP